MRRDDLCHAVRQRLVRLPAPYDAHYGVVPPPPPEGSLGLREVREVMAAAQAALGKVDLLAKEIREPFLISRILTRREAVASSAMEGTNSTLDELLAVEETREGAATDAARQVREYVLALDQALPLARQTGPTIFTEDLVKGLHRQVMRDDPGYRDVPGELRGCVVWIGPRSSIAYSTYNPPPPATVAQCLAESLVYMRCEGMQVMTQGLLARMAVAHAHFEAVHPFRDGNGRVGRLLLPLMMAADGEVPLYLSPYIEAHKDQYYAALKAAQQRLEWADIVGFLAEAVVGTVDELMATRAALARLREIWLGRRAFRRNSAALRALDRLPQYPVLTIGRLAEVLEISFKNAAAAMDQLLAAGVVVERTGYARNRVFAAQEALTLINRPFGAEPYLPE